MTTQLPQENGGDGWIKLPVQIKSDTQAGDNEGGGERQKGAYGAVEWERDN